MNLIATQKKQLQDEGYIFLKNVLSLSQVQQLRDHLETLWQKEGAEAGIENYQEPNTRRLANLADKGNEFVPIFTNSLILDACREVMGNQVRLSMLNARDSLPHSGARQMWHCDTDSSGRPDDFGFYSCTAIWMLDKFSEENGATYFVPRTHLTGKVPKDIMEDRYASHPDEFRVVGNAGDVFVFNGHCWHAGGENQSDYTRRAILAHYLRADKLPNRADRRQYLSEETKAKFSTDALTLLGASE